MSVAETRLCQDRGPPRARRAPRAPAAVLLLTLGPILAALGWRGR